MVRRAGEKGFTRVSWDDALDLVAGRIRATTPDRVALYLTARGITNEVYYVAQKAARAIGTNNVDNAARVCHAPSTTALKAAIGVAATTCSYRDVIDSDLIVLFGSDVANGQPVFMKYLYLAKKRGAKVAVVNPLREPGLEHYWVPSNVESAMFGTKVTDEFFPVHTGGDIAFVNGVLKHLLAIGGLDARVHEGEHGRLRGAARRARARVIRGARARVGGDERRHGALRAHVRGGAPRGARMVDGYHPARARRRERARDREPRACPRQRRTAGRRVDADPRPLGRAGRRRDGLLLNRVPRRGAR